MSKEIIIIPDIHGRTFWKEAVEKYPDADTIFLGDYLDPYEYEHISFRMAMENFKEIIEHVKSHPNCHLLIGNHDLHYLIGQNWSRKNWHWEEDIEKLMTDNIEMFDFIAIRELNGKSYVFTHAPIFKEWSDYTEMPTDIKLLQTQLRDMLKEAANNKKELNRLFGRATSKRGGHDVCGSPVWADLDEAEKNTFVDGGDYFIFGHTQLGKPVITDNYACLDCHQAFRLDEDGKIEAITEKKTPDLPKSTGGWF